MIQVIAVVTPTLDLSDLSGSINHEHSECKKAYQKSLFHARNCGELLICAQNQVRQKNGGKKGGWYDWLEENTEIPERTARVYMQVARDWPKLEEAANVQDLTVKDALLLLSEEPQEDALPQLETASTPIHPTQDISSFKVGDRPVVANSDNLFDGQEVEIVGREGNFLLAKTENGREFPFMASEFQAQPKTGCSNPEPKPAPKKLTVALLKGLLERAYLEAGGHLSMQLAQEIAAAIAA
jgi:hypothetical protein